MASPLDFITGKAKRKPSATQETETVGKITAANCIQFDNSGADFGGNAGSGLGQDIECSRFEKELQRQLEKATK